MFTKSNTKTTIEALERCVPIVIIDKKALAKMKIYVEENSEEVGWLGMASKEDGFYYISDVMLFDQDVHATTTEITPEGLSEFGMKVLEQEDGMDIWNSIRLWGHSHVNMPTSPSGQDNSQMEVFADNGHDFFIRIIANKKSDLALDLYEYTTGVIYKNIVWYKSQTEQEIQINKEIKEMENRIEQLQDNLDEEDENILADIKPNIILEIASKVKSKINNVVKIGSVYDNYVNEQIDKKKTQKEKSIWEEKKTIDGTVIDEDEDDDAYGYEKNVDFDTFELDGMTLVELSMCTTIFEAEDIIESNGYEAYITQVELSGLLIDLWDDNYYKSYGTYMGGMI